MSNIRIDIASEFKDKGFKQAEKATTNLNRQMKTLASTLGVTLSARAVVQFGKASVKAFSDDQKAALRLSQTLKNLGLAFEDTRVTDFISNLEATSGVLDDELRPAMQSLLMVTGSVTKSQELMNLALEMSRGTGVDLATVANDLSKAYVGQTRSLSKYNTGLTRAELQTKSFAELQQILSKQFSGQSAAYLETYAGKVGLLNVAYANMQETVGKGLVDAFEILSGDGGIGAGTSAMRIFGDEIANTTRGIAVLISSFDSMSSMGYGVLNLFKALAKERNLIDAIQSLGQQAKPLFFPTAGDPLAIERARAKAEQDALKRQKELLKLQQKAAREAAKRAAEAAKREKELAQLKRAGSVFDMENIQIVAAMQGKITDEQRLRLTALFALNNDNAKAAEALTLAILAANKAAFEAIGVTFEAGDNVEKLISKIIKAQANILLINSGIDTIKEAKNPFEKWTDYIAAVLAGIAQINNALSTITPPTVPTPSTPLTPGAGAGNYFPAGIEPGAGVTFNPSGTPMVVPIGTPAAAFDDPAMYLPGFDNTLANPQLNWQKEGDTYVTNVTVEGSVTSSQDLVDMIINEIYEAQRGGTGIIFDPVAL